MKYFLGLVCLVGLMGCGASQSTVTNLTSRVSALETQQRQQAQQAQREAACRTAVANYSGHMLYCAFGDQDSCSIVDIALNFYNEHCIQQSE